MCNKGNQGLKLGTRKYLYNTREQWWTRTTTKKKTKKKNPCKTQRKHIAKCQT